ncbi:MAG: ribulose 1,5-bisphosphate carboxylase large subunit, partial [Nitrospirota bacterium]
SLKPGIRVVRLHLPDEVVKKWPGPRLGREGLRQRIGVPHRPLICGVLKPVGLSPGALADLAYQFAIGGLDLIKDDQGLVDQTFCPFDTRMSQCAAAVVKANRETGRHCLYFPNVTGSGKGIYKRALLAQEAGAGGVLICPGLAGFDAIRVLAHDERLDLPVISHPTLLGSFIVNPDSGIAPAVLFGQLPRLAGADISIYPTFGGSFPITAEDCRQIATETAVPWGDLKQNFPTAAGRIHLDSVGELFGVYLNEMVIVVGGEILQPGKKVVDTCREFVDHVTRLAKKG